MDPVITRRGVLLGGGLCVLALGGCSSYGPEGGSGASSGPKTKLQVAASEIPVGSGKIFDEAQVVITQPTSGNFKAFTSICTHLQCPVAAVSTTIDCNCHGSKFSITDGSVVHDPATAPLAAYPITLSGDQLTVG